MQEPAAKNVGEASAVAVTAPREQEDAPLALDVRLDRRHTVSDQVYDALKDAIVSVKLLPGTSISENRICRHFGVSRTPVRTAIVRLVEEGLIDVYPQQGSFVAPIRLSGIADSRFVRNVLELAVLREAGAVWAPEFGQRARTIVAAQVEACAAGDQERFHREDERFHHGFSVIARREGVWSTIVLAKARAGRVHRLFGDADRMPVVVQEHVAILDALDAGDVEEAVRRLQYHLDKVFELIEQLPERCRPYVAD
jgi:DNA-binding GntR family transcriptional regulator